MPRTAAAGAGASRTRRSAPRGAEAAAHLPALSACRRRSPRSPSRWRTRACPTHACPCRPRSLAEICVGRPRRRGPRTPTASPTWTTCARFRGLYDHAPDVVARPRDEREVEAVLEWAGAANAAVIPYGGGTSVVGGVEARIPERFDGAVYRRPRRPGPAARGRRRLARRTHRRGRGGPRLEQLLGEHGLTMRFFPQSFELSTLGGWIATRAGGHFATRRRTSTISSRPCARSRRPARGSRAGCRARAPGRAPTGCCSAPRASSA